MAFRFDQARAPKGTPIGGQWIDEGRASDALSRWTSQSLEGTGTYGKAKEQGKRWAKDKERNDWDHVYARTQLEIARKGLKVDRAFRGVQLSSADELAKAIASGQIGVGSEGVLPDRFWFDSWTDNPMGADQFVFGASGGKVGVVFETIVDPRDVVAHYAITDELRASGEREIILRGHGKTRVRIVAIHVDGKRLAVKGLVNPIKTPPLKLDPAKLAKAQRETEQAMAILAKDKRR